MVNIELLQVSRSAIVTWLKVFWMQVHLVKSANV